MRTHRRISPFSRTLVSVVAIASALGCSERPCIVINDEEICVPGIGYHGVEGGDLCDDGSCYCDDVGCDQEYVEPAFGADGCHGFVAIDFDFPDDELACSGGQFMRYDENHQRFVGVVACDEDDTGEAGARGVYRLYLSVDADGLFHPASDTAGHGQDHCELIQPGFFLDDEDDITSGGCSACSTSANLPLEGVLTWNRAEAGEVFRLEESEDWAWQTSQLGCGLDLATCSEVLPPNALR